MKNMFSLALMSIVLIFASSHVHAQEGDDERSDVKFKLRPYVTGYMEKRYYVNSAERNLYSGDLSRGYAIGGQFRFANFNYPIRLGYFEQTTNGDAYQKSLPSSRILKGIEFSFGYDPNNRLLFYALLRGGIYGKGDWNILRPNNELSGLLALGTSYRLQIGSKKGGGIIEPGIQLGAMGSEGLAWVVSLTIRPYW